MDQSIATKLYNLVSRGTGNLPRRACYVHDVLFDLRDAPPGAEELPILSKICELLREERGEKVYARDIPRLLHECLRTYDEKAWSALCDDAMKELLTPILLTEYFEEHPEDAGCFAWQFKAASSISWCASIVKVLSLCIPCFPEKAHASFSESLRHGHGHALLLAYTTHCKSLPSAIRRLALERFGALIYTKETFDYLAKETLCELNRIPTAEDVLTILLSSTHAATLRNLFSDDEKMRVIRNVYANATKAPISRRGPYLHVLSLLLDTGHHGIDIDALLVHTLRGYNVESCDTSVVLNVLRVIDAIEPPQSFRSLLVKACIQTMA